MLWENLIPSTKIPLRQLRPLLLYAYDIYDNISKFEFNKLQSKQVFIAFGCSNKLEHREHRSTRQCDVHSTQTPTHTSTGEDTWAVKGGEGRLINVTIITKGPLRPRLVLLENLLNEIVIPRKRVILLVEFKTN
jgi:hypothetical protein